MSKYLVEDTRKVTTNRFIEMKRKGEKIAMLTAYDYTTASILDAAGIDALLVGDSASNVMAGNATTLPITVDEMIFCEREFDYYGNEFTYAEIENLNATGVIANNKLDFSTCVNLTHDSLMSIINILKDFSDTGETRHITFGEVNLAKLTDAEKAIATQKGWTLS